MAKYRITVGGWEYHMKARSVDQELIDRAIELEDIWDIEEEIFEGDMKIDYEASGISWNEGLYFTIEDENGKELETFNETEFNYGDVIEDDDQGYESVCIDPEYVEEYENTLLLVHEYKRSYMEFEVESDTPVTQKDISSTTLSIESPEGDYDLINKIGFRDQLLEPNDWQGGDGKASYVKIYKPGEEPITIGW